MKTSIISLGVATPPTKISQEDSALFMANLMPLTVTEKHRLCAIYKGTGIEYRYSVLKDYQHSPAEYDFFPKNMFADFPSTAKRMEIYQATALPLALQAITKCLEELPPTTIAEITHLITVSCTGMYAPGLDIEIAQHLNLRSDVQRTAINFMGCYAVVNALKVADAICQANSKATVLVVSVELCTLHAQKSKKLGDIVASAIFADGAAAALLRAQPLTNKYLTLEHFHCDLIPQTDKEMAWGIGDSGFNIVLTSYVPQAIQSAIARFVERFLQATNISLASINKYAIHPGGIKILQACETALGISAEDNKHSYKVLRDFGNMSSATILFVLRSLWDELTIANHNNIIFSCAFGPGLTLESMLLQAHCV